MSLLSERHKQKLEWRKEKEELKWARMRIGWADFRNANRGKNGKLTRPIDLIKLSFDDGAKTEFQTKVIDMDAVKRRLGSKIKKKNGT